MLPLILLTALAAQDRPLSPEEARKSVGRKVTVEMEVASAKERLEKRGAIYLDSQADFRDPKNFAVVISRKGAMSLQEAGVDPVADYKGNIIRATGVVRLVEGAPRIDIDRAEQISLLKAARKASLSRPAVGFLAPLRPEMPVEVRETAAGFHLRTGVDGKKAFTVIEVGSDYVVVRAPDGAAELRIPVHAIRVIVTPGKGGGGRKPY